jgi:hypothetical protein
MRISRTIGLIAAGAALVNQFYLGMTDQFLRKYGQQPANTSRAQ